MLGVSGTEEEDAVVVVVVVDDHSFATRVLARRRASGLSAFAAFKSSFKDIDAAGAGELFLLRSSSAIFSLWLM